MTLNAAGTATAWHFNLLAGEKPIGRQPNTGARSYYHTDLLGSTRAVVQGATVTESYDYDPYGLLMPGRTLAGATREGFTGKERDLESGLDYFGQRLLMPALGRWSTVDPVADSFPQWNPYNYVEGNPASYSDPFGLNPCLPWCLVVAGWAAYELGSAAYDVYQAYKTVRDPSASNTQRSVMVAAAAASVLGPLGGGTVVIGKVDDLFRGVRAGERTLLPRMADDLGSPGANWARNAGLLRQEMARGRPIRDASVDPRTGALLPDSRANGSGSFLTMERNLLRERGWTYDARTQYWNAPQR